MRILTAREMRAADEDTFTRLGVPSRAVMERAGREVVHVLCERYFTSLSRVAVITGGGNNGGDGFVVARILHEMRIPVVVIAAKGVGELHGDAAAVAASYIAAGGKVVELAEVKAEGASAELDRFRPSLIVDAIFGTGFQGPVRGDGAALVGLVTAAAGRLRIPVVAIDLPSGLDSDSSEIPGDSVNAHCTVALQALKLCHVLYPAAGRCGEVVVADIGVSLDVLSTGGAPSPMRELITEDKVRAILSGSTAFDPGSHKGKRGHVLVVGGSAGHYGAPKLSAEAALRAGAGLATVVLPHTAAERLAPQVNEVMCASLPDDSEGSFAGTGIDRLEALLAKIDAVVVGPGLGTNEGAERLLLKLFQLLQKSETALVLDADALNLISRSDDVRSALPAGAIVTPHPGEMARLLKLDGVQVQRDRVGAAVALRSALHATAVLKGARTVVAVSGGSLYVNPAANAVLATAGAGDVLAGVIGALAAQGLQGGEAAIAGVFVHGAAGELLVEENGGPYGVLAGDIARAVPRVMNRVDGRPGSQPVRAADTESGSTRRVLPGSFARRHGG